MGTESTLPDRWFFEEQPAGRSHSPGLLQKKTLDRSLDTFVREVLQNVNDAGLDNDDPVRVTFRLVDLTDDEEFRDAVRWDDLLTHVRGAAKEQNGPGLEEYLEYLNDGGSFRVLVVEEENTTGIQGDEISPGTDYTALVRDPGSSNKTGETAGRHGLGSSVLWVASGLQTVLFNSVLADEEPGQESPRFVGRSFIPTHETPDGAWHENEGWFGSPTGFDDDDLQRPESVWDGPARDLADRLRISRPDVSGTSTAIVGFRDPSDPSMSDQPNPSEIADTFEESAAEYFWPAISQGDLEVHLDMEGDERTVDSDTIEDFDSVAPYIECYEGRTDAPKTLGGPGQVASLEFPYEIRSKRKEQTPSEGKVSLAVRRAYPDEEERIGDIAMFRGSGMVVKYKPAHHLGFSGKFHAVLACGNARPGPDEDPTQADRAIEEFLAMAEPPAHDEWYGKNNDELKGDYEDGSVKCIRKLKTGLLREYLSDLLYGDEDEGGETLNPGRAILPRTRSSRGRSEHDGTPSIPSPFDYTVDSEIVHDHWVFRGVVGPDEDVGDVVDWSVTIGLKAMYEDNSEADDIPIADVELRGSSDARWSSSDGEAEVVVDSGVNELRFTIESKQFGDTDPRLGDVGETKFKITDGTIHVEEGE